MDFKRSDGDTVVRCELAAAPRRPASVAPVPPLDAVQRDLGIGPGETTADKKVSLLTARCLGSCGLAPAVVYDQEVAGKVGSAAIREHLKKWTTQHDA